MAEKFGLISIIMAAYNAAKTISFAIDSVIAQTYTDWELLVINDCSKDSTGQIVSEYAAKDSRIKLLNNEQNCGVSVTRLNGLKAASGEWIAVLDSDDAWLPEKLEKQVRLQQSSAADIVFTGSAFINAEGEKLDWVLHVPEKVSYRRLLKQNVISNSSSLVRRKLYSDYYASGDGMHEDFALWLRLLKAGYTACGVDEPLLIYRLSSTSKSGNKFKSLRMNWRTYRYLRINVFSSAYYMCWYTLNGILKYKNLR